MEELVARETLSYRAELYAHPFRYRADKNLTEFHHRIQYLIMDMSQG